MAITVPGTIVSARPRYRCAAQRTRPARDISWPLHRGAAFGAKPIESAAPPTGQALAPPLYQASGFARLRPGRAPSRFEVVVLEHSGWNLSLIHISEPTRQAEISYAVF